MTTTASTSISHNTRVAPPLGFVRQALILQPHMLELGRDRSSLLIVTAFGERLFVAAVGGPMPEMLRTDGIAELVERKDAPKFRY